MVVRPAAREDFETLFALDRACFRPGIAYSRAELRHFLLHSKTTSLVAEDEGRIVGFAIVEFAHEGDRGIGHVVTIDVGPSQRRRGVGLSLMEAVLDDCRKRNVAEVHLEVAVDNEGAQAFYRTLGFSVTGRIRGFYMGRLDALRMELALTKQSADEAVS